MSVGNPLGKHSLGLSTNSKPGVASKSLKREIEKKWKLTIYTCVNLLLSSMSVQWELNRKKKIIYYMLLYLCVVGLMLIFIGSLPDSNLLAMVTLFPKRQYLGIFTPNQVPSNNISSIPCTKVAVEITQVN